MKLLFTNFIITYIFLNSYSTFVKAQNTHPDSVTFTGRVINFNRKHIIDEFIVRSPKAIDSVPKIYYFPVSDSGDFKFKFPISNNFNEFWFGLSADQRRLLVLNPNLNRFMVEVGDTVHIEATVNGDNVFLNFSGEGSEKYSIKQRLDSIWTKFSLDRTTFLKSSYPERNVKNSTQLERQLNQEAMMIRKRKDEIEAMIDGTKINSPMKIILSREKFDISLFWLQRLESYYWENKTYLNQIVSTYNRYKYEFSIKSNAENLVFPKSSYVAALSYSIIFEQAISKPSIKISLPELYYYIKANYRGDLRDMLLFRCFESVVGTSLYVMPFNNVQLLELIEDAADFVKEPSSKAAIIRRLILLKKSLGNLVYDGEFVDINEKPFQLKSLRGKVVLIDGWFNGCSGCAKFHEYFSNNVYPYFKDNKDFVVLSINADTKREEWIKGLKSNLYSTDHYINVNASTGIKHPFFAYYGVKGFSWIMLIDSSGKVCYSPNGTTDKMLIAQINEALSTLKNSK